jgi:Fe-S-cluster containining protein
MTPEQRLAAIAEIFSCARCGSCCHGQTTVSLSPDDQERMRQTLCLTTNEMREDYLRLTGKEVQMQIRNGHCVFYQEGCRVHQARPWRCAQWPLHPAILLDEANFTAIADSCPGINKNLDYQRFTSILRAILEDSPQISC